MIMKNEIQLFIAQYQQRIEHRLAESLPASNNELHQAMRYSSLDAGKRLRPLLVYATSLDLCGQVPQGCDEVAMAIELAHAFSLVHDDLPAMDNDDYRRGKLSCHKQFGEAVAILAGDALFIESIQIITQAPLSDDVRVNCLRDLCCAIGANGMVLGQSLDILAEGQSLALTELENIHHNKTGKLICSSIQLGAYVSQVVDTNVTLLLEEYGCQIGLAYQIQNDLLDISTAPDALGRPVGSDLQANKATYPRLLGVDGAKRALDMAYQKAFSILEQLPMNAHNLQGMTQYLKSLSGEVSVINASEQMQDVACATLDNTANIEGNSLNE